MTDPKSIHPEASYQTRLPEDDTNASRKAAPYPFSGLPQIVDSTLSWTVLTDNWTVLTEQISSRVLFRCVSPSFAR